MLKKSCWKEVIYIEHVPVWLAKTKTLEDLHSNEDLDSDENLDNNEIITWYISYKQRNG